MWWRASLVAVVVLLPACNLCQPTPPTPPPADSCDNPSAMLLPANLEVGGDTYAGFAPWPADGAVAMLSRGGQGLNMLGVRYRLQVTGSPTCVSQETILLGPDGAELSRRSEALRVYPQADGTVATRTLWMVLDSGGLDEGDRATVRATVGGVGVTRVVELQAEKMFPRPLGIWPQEACVGTGVRFRVGLDRPAPEAGWVVPVEFLVPGAAAPQVVDAVFDTQQMTQDVTVDLPVEGEATVTVLERRDAEETRIPVMAAGSRGASLPWNVVEGPQQSRVEVAVELHCPPSADEALQLSWMGQPRTVMVPAWTPVVVVRVTIPQGGGRLQVTRGGITQVLEVHEQAAMTAENSGLQFTELYLPDTLGAPLDAVCNGTLTGAFVEVGNPTAYAVDVSGVTVEGQTNDGNPLTVAQLPDRLVLGPGQHVVVASGVAPSPGQDAWCAGMRDALTSARWTYGNFAGLNPYQPVVLRAGSRELDRWDFPISPDDNRAPQGPRAGHSFAMPVTPGVGMHGAVPVDLP